MTTPSLTRAPAVSSACDHPYHPVKASALWRYQAQASGLPTVNYTLTHVDVTTNGFTERREYSNNLTADIKWNCSDDGLVAAQYANLAASQSQFKFEYLKTNGVTIPPANRWTVGSTWSYGYEVRGQVTTRGNPTNAQGTIDISNQIVAQEALTVPSGDYNALKVGSRITMKLTVSVSGVTVPVDMSFNSTSWFAQNVGMVKTTNTDPIVSTTELISFTQ
ncbi:MAG: hypothetical protein HYS05_11695 [Acidobacteria bacterium]|nr:hypothetical protein [Acidobacteriota bacterium]